MWRLSVWDNASINTRKKARDPPYWMMSLRLRMSPCGYGNCGKMSAHARLFWRYDENITQRVHVSLTIARLRAKDSLLLQR